MQIKILIHCLLLFMTIPAAYSQKLVFENLGVKQGLPGMEVYNLWQDKDGYVWVFSEYGIVKHNGSKFIPVCQNIPLKERVVYAVAGSKSDELFVANSKGKIYQIRDDKAYLVKGLEKHTKDIRALSQPILNLFLDNQNTMYFSNFQKTYVVPEKAYRAIKTKEAKSAPVQRAPEPVYALRSGDYWTGDLSVTLQDRAGKVHRKLQRDSIGVSRTFGSLYNGNLYFCLLNELQLYRKDGTMKSYNFGHSIINFKVAPNGHLWAGLSSGGLVELDSELNPLEHYIGNVTVSDILFDNQSGMWVSTIGEGIYYCSNTDNLSFHDVPGLKQITAMKTINELLFIGTASGKLFVKDRKLREIDLEGNSACVNDVIKFDGNYYIGTKLRIYVLNSKFKVIEVIHKSGYSFETMADGALVLIDASAIFRKRKNTGFIERIRQNTWNRSLVQREPGEFFVILFNGEEVYRMKFNTFFSPGYLNELKGKHISRIRTDKQKNLWICTKGEGLYRLTRSNKLIHYPDLPSEIINDINFLSDYIVLLSTNKGAFVCRLNQIQNKSSWLKLHDEEVIRMAVLKDEVLIGTTSGLISVNIDKLFRRINYRFFLSSVEYENQQVSLEQLRTLNYKQNDLYFDYDLLAYSEPEKQLDYYLKGPSSLNGHVEGTQVHLQNLSPGQYTLTVFPHNKLAHGNDLKIVTHFYIHPAFWQTSWFLVLLILSGLILTILGSWWFMRSRRKKELQRTHIEKLLAEYQLTALKAQVNPHFMSNSLVAIQSLIIRKETSKATQYLAKFSMLIRYLLDYSDQQVTSLYNEMKVIDLYVALEQLRFSDRFRFIKEIDEDVQLDQLFIPSLITQPLLENAIWHGLLPLTEERIPTLTLAITVDENKLCISISDNGVGRADPSLKPGNLRPFKESKGTKLIEKRIENLNKLYSPSKGWIEFIDLKDETGKPVGSTVRLYFSLDLINKLYYDRNQECNY